MPQWLAPATRFFRDRANKYVALTTGTTEGENQSMPKPILSTDGKPQPRALVVALRRIAKDPKATVKQRLRACELQAIIAGYTRGHNRANSAVPENEDAKPLPGGQSPRNSPNLKRLLLREEEDRKKGLSEARDFSPTRQSNITES
jgi:hypothetical protein